MRVEHVGFIVNAPVSMGRWYAEHLGWRLLASSGNDEAGGAFLKDDASGTIIELTRPSGQGNVDYLKFHPLQAHLAIDCDDPYAFAEQLVKAGGTIIEQSPRTPGTTRIVMVRDPWGFSMQLINRAVNSTDRGGLPVFSWAALPAALHAK